MIYIDTSKLREAGEKVISSTTSYFSTINTMFDGINNVSENLGEWSGNAAVQFIRNSNVDKKQYVTLGNDLNAYGLNMIANASKIETLCREIKYK